MKPQLAFLLLLVPLLALAPAQASSHDALHVNVVSARSVGCSPDFFTSPDLRVKVYVNGALAVETVEAQDADEPLYASLTLVRTALPALVRVEVEEGEPGGFLGRGTSWKPCDAAPGVDRHLNVTVEGPTQRVVARGDDADAAEAVVTVGRDAPAAPTLRVTNVTTTEARLAWSGAPNATAHRVALPGYRGVLAVAGPGDATAVAAGLCDNRAYALRLVRDQGPWSVASPDAAFTTANAPPQPPRVLAAERNGSAVNVSWESPTWHDVASFEVHAGPTAAFAPSPGTLRGTASPSLFGPTARLDGVALQPGDAFVRVRTLDTGGLNATSDALAFNATQPATVTSVPDCARPGSVTVSGGAAPPPATTTTTTATTPPTQTTTTSTTTTTTTTTTVATTPPPTNGTTTTTTTTTTPPPTDGGGGGIGWPYVVAIALGAAAVGGVLVLAMRR